MPTKYIKASLPHLNLLTKIILIIGIFAMAIFGVFALRMQKGPMELDFAKARIEAALSDAEKGYKVEIDKAALTWPEITEELLLDLSGVKIIQKEVVSLSVDRVSLGLSELHLLRGKILPSRLIIDGPTFKLSRQNGELNFFWQEQERDVSKEQKEQETPKEIRAQIIRFLEQITDPKNNDIGVLSALKRFEIKRAVIADESGRDGGYLALADIALRKHDLGLQGDMVIDLPGEAGQSASLKSDILYRIEQKDLTFTADVKDINPARLASFFPEQTLLAEQNLFLGGAIKAAFDGNLRLEMATLDLQVPEGQLFVPEAYDKPVPLKDVVFNATLNRSEGKLDITSFKAVVGGIGIEAKTAATIQKGQIHALLEVKIPELPLDSVPPIFPKSHLESSAGEWLTQKLSKGYFRDVVMTTDFNVTRDPETKERDAVMTNTRLSFKADGVTVKYSDTLMPVTDVIGEGVYENDSLTITGQSGTIGGDVIGRNIKVKMTDLSVKGGGLADINLDAKGPLITALKYVSDEPIAVGDELGFYLNNAKGDVDFNLQLNFPTVKDLPKEEVKVKIKGKANDIVLPKVVRGLSLTGGPYDLGFSDGAITLKGSGALDGRPITLDWLQYLNSDGREYESKIAAKITADEGLRKAFGIGLEDYISGPLPVDVTYIDRGVKATAEVKGDLAPATLHIDPFDYRKEPNVKGDLSLKAYVKGDTLEEVDQLQLKTTGFSLADGRILFRPLQDGGSDISRGTVPVASLGRTTVAVDFEVTPQDVLKIVAKGAVVDLLPFIQTDKKDDRWSKPKEETEQPKLVSVTANKMLMHDGETIRNAKLYLETDKDGDITRIEMDAKVGEGDMYLRFKPEADTGKRTFRMESSDAGYALKVFGLYDKARGGHITIYGQPHSGDKKGDLYGIAKMEDFRVKGAPALAKLLGATSMNGAQDLLKNDGLHFAKLESDFEWRFREQGNLLVVKEGRTSGSSLGLTFEGVVNQATNETDVSGTIIPLSGLNQALGQIPLVGTLLSGGGGALFAATYKMSGPSNDPTISINPLSVLAPGFLRRILFEENVEQKVKKAE